MLYVKNTVDEILMYLSVILWQERINIILLCTGICIFHIDRLFITDEDCVIK